MLSHVEMLEMVGFDKKNFVFYFLKKLSFFFNNKAIKDVQAGWKTNSTEN